MWMCLVLTLSAAAMDHSGLQAVLSAHVDSSGNVDYAAVKSSGALEAYLEGLQGAAEPAGQAEKMAFWINAYNALTIDLIADNYPINSIRDLDGGDPWNARRFSVAGRQVTLNDIEHNIIRPMGDARIHAAVNCASRGCPPLSRTAFTGAGLDGQLDAVSRAWISGNGISIQDGAVSLNQIFDWYGDDFIPDSDVDIPGVDGKAEAALSFAARYLPAEQAAFIKAGGYTVGYGRYDWALNQQ